MKIQTKLSLVIFLSMLSLAGLGYMGFQSYKQMIHITSSLNQGAELNGLIFSIANSPFYNSLEKKLVGFEDTLSPEYRNKSIKEIIKHYKARNRIRLNQSILRHRKQEKRYLKTLRENLEICETNMKSIATAFCIALVLSFFLIIRIVSKSVFSPLQGLSKRMIDFLNNRYTYQFRIPKKNEVGELELNFHSLAQRVLNNIEELKALDSAKSDFLNIASHELRTPLTSIKGSLSLLKNGLKTLPEEKSRQLFEIAENETDRLIRLINDLLDLAKIEAGKLPLEKQWTSIDNVIEKTLYSLEGISKTAQVSLSYKKGQFKLVEIDEDKVQQVLTNLVSNAIKYSPDNGVVSVNVLIDHSNHLRVEVQDQGKGISPDDQKLIFEKFRQATGPASPIVKGTGLGLAIAKAVIEEHNGVIGVHSQVGKGSTFYFTLPDWKQDEITIDFKEKRLAENQRHEDKKPGAA